MASTNTGGLSSPSSVRESVMSEQTAVTTVSSQIPATGGKIAPVGRPAIVTAFLTYTGGEKSVDKGKAPALAIGVTNSSSSASENILKKATSSNTSSHKAFTTHPSTNIKMERENFSTDSGETRVVEIKNAIWDDFDKHIKDMSTKMTIIQVIKTKHEGPHITVMIYFDDLRCAKSAKDWWGTRMPGSTLRFATTHEFAAQIQATTGMGTTNDVTNLAQYEIIGEWTGTSEDFSVGKVIDSLLELAGSFGDVRSFALLNNEKTSVASVRVEYHRLSHSKLLVDSTGLGHAHKIDDIKITVKQYRLQTPKTTALVPHSPQDVAAAFPDTPATMNTNPYAYGTPSSQQTNPYGPPAIMQNGYAYDDGAAFANQGRGAFTGPINQVQGLFNAMDGNGMPTRFYTPHTYGFNPYANHRDQNFDPELREAQNVSVANIESGMDVRTTIMIRNVPNRFSSLDMYNILASTSKGHFDFLYLRMDFSNSCNVGYGFVNFVRPELIIPFLKTRIGKPWPGVVCDKVCEISYATSQGQDCLIQKFRNSSVMNEYPGFRPKLFYHIDSVDTPDDKQAGDEMPFPPPDNRQKLARSLANAQTIGLFPPRGANGNREGRRTRTQWDRGTPGALRDEAMYGPRRGYQGYNYAIAPAQGPMNYGPIAPPMQTMALPMQASTYGNQTMTVANTPRYVPTMNAHQPGLTQTPTRGYQAGQYNATPSVHYRY